MRNSSERNTRNFSFKSSTPSSSDKSLSLSPSPILQTNTKSLNLRHSTGLDAPFVKTIPSACPLKEPLPDILLNFEKIPQIENPGSVQGLNSKSREHQRNDSKDLKEKSEDNNLIFLLFAEIERLLLLLNERDREIERLKKLQNDEETSDKNAKSSQRNYSSRNSNSKISIGENEKNSSPSRFSKKNCAENNDSVWKKKWEQENKLHIDLQHKYNLLLKSKNQMETENTKTEEKKNSSKGVGDGVIVNFKDNETQTQKNEDNLNKNAEKKRGTNVQISLDSWQGQKNVGDINEVMSTKETNREEIKTIEKLWQDDRKNIECLKQGMEQRENIIQKQENEIQKNYKKMTDMDNIFCAMKKDFDGKIKGLISELKKKDKFIEETEKNIKTIKFEFEDSLTKNKNLSEELKIRTSIIENLKENVAENLKNQKRFLMNIDENEQRSDNFFINQIKLLECKTSAYEDIFSDKKKEFEESLRKSQKEIDELKKTIDDLKLQIEKLEKEKASLGKQLNDEKTANDNLKKIIKLIIENKENPNLIEKELEKSGDIEFLKEIKEDLRDYTQREKNKKMNENISEKQNEDLRDFNENMKKHLQLLEKEKEDTVNKNKFLTKIIKIITNKEGYSGDMISKIIENELEKNPNSEELKDSKEFLMDFVEKEKKFKTENEREKFDLRDFNETLKKQVKILEKEKEKCELKTKEESEKNGALRKILLLMTDFNDSSTDHLSKTIGDSLKEAYKAEEYQEINEKIMNFLMKQSDCMKILSDVKNSPSKQKNTVERNKSINFPINNRDNALAQTEKMNKYLTIENQNTEPKKKTRAIYLTTNSEKKEATNSEQKNPFFRTMENYLKISNSDLQSEKTKNKVDGTAKNSEDCRFDEMNNIKIDQSLEKEKEMQLVNINNNLNFETKENPDNLNDYNNDAKHDKNKKSIANQKNHQITQKSPNVENEKILINTPISRNPYLIEINTSQEKITDEQVFQNRLSQAITIFHSKLLDDSHIGQQQSSLSQFIDNNSKLTKSNNIDGFSKLTKSNNNLNFDPSNNFQNPETFIGPNANIKGMKTENQDFSTHKKPALDRTTDYLNTESNVRLLTFNNNDDFLSPKKSDQPIEYFGSRENEKVDLEGDKDNSHVFRPNIVESNGERRNLDFQNENYNAIEEKPFFSEQKNTKNREYSNDYFTKTQEPISQRINDHSNSVSIKEKEFVKPSENQISKKTNENLSNYPYQRHSKSIDTQNPYNFQKKTSEKPTERENNENSNVNNSPKSHNNSQNFGFGMESERFNPKLKTEISAKEYLGNNTNEENKKCISAEKFKPKNLDSTQPAEKRIFNQHRRGSASLYDILRELKHSENVFKIVAIENENLSKITKENEAIFRDDVNYFIKKIKTVY